MLFVGGLATSVVVCITLWRWQHIVLDKPPWPVCSVPPAACWRWWQMCHAVVHWRRPATMRPHCVDSAVQCFSVIVGRFSSSERCCRVTARWPVYHEALGDQVCNGRGVHCSSRWPGANPVYTIALCQVAFSWKNLKHWGKKSVCRWQYWGIAV